MMGERRLARPRRRCRRRPARPPRSCGAARGTARSRSARRRAAPATLWIRVTSIASSRDSGGRIDGSRRASIVLPVPGAPSISRLWPPAAAICSASSGASWPRTSAQVRRAARAGRGSRLGVRQRRRRRAREHGGGLAQRADRDDLKALDERRLPRALARDDQPRASGAAALPRRRRAPRASRAARRRARARRTPRTPRGWRRAAGRWQRAAPSASPASKPGTGLAQRRRRQVGRDPPVGEAEARVEDRRADPVPRLAHGGVAEPDDREGGQARRGCRPRPTPAAAATPSMANVVTCASIGGTLRPIASQVSVASSRFCADFQGRLAHNRCRSTPTCDGFLRSVPGVMSTAPDRRRSSTPTPAAPSEPSASSLPPTT